ncbi:uncharacterized protein NFIA_035200 [Aspergillus fischeri NRRL 181]|uniref:Serine/threonine-protein kinase ppk6 n=1 Tax=Neosartorya fischeri (strain ATCC 1020 / DSM 3700 / CBS 544.65 / FGSC A1164 / JCM 1740 / NRRL 181 / WB 181) TaxID=331117 RepID=A1CYY2_NEOFI|nr:conserved hypothetical protein [Aspergillus fischeri NRRL 181]EAW23952.1 conserved hypothetical protein [Aspergillus fischeri NRRL 181]KAG2026847.1 hypothetical protein GB937_001637 [Aspergillus fischeri]
MSADLFAEFGNKAPSAQPSNVSHQRRPGSQAHSLIPDLDVLEDVVSSNPQTDVQDQASSSHIKQSQAPPNQFALASNTDFPKLQDYNDGSNVLFDATLESMPDDEEDEDWGEFESAESATGRNQSAARFQQQDGLRDSQSRPKDATTLIDVMDTLSIADSKLPNASKPAVRQSIDKPRSHIKAVDSIAVPDPAQDDSFEDWGEFIDGPPAEVKPPKFQGFSKSRSPEGKITQARTAVLTSPSFTIPGEKVSESQIRPTNIPPPSVLLELFPRLFEKLREEATKARRCLQQEDQVETAASLVLCTLKVVARVVAGRTLRWKRDTILSQSMRIGPARSGKPGGMKLSTVNKNESIKEQQEAVDVLTMWRDQAALFNSVIQASGRQPIQAIAENARVVTATAAHGAIKAPHACALCGLKRDERLPKIDENVQDSFGEWWVEHWGHSECKGFWETNMGLLAQR